jgi:lipopolysaccharide transport system ATP-binding protein
MSEVLVDVESLTKKFSKNFKRGAKTGIKKAVSSILGISFKDTSQSPEDFHALENVSFKLKRGQTLGLLGRNGAGKSTLLKHISGIYLPDLGSVTVIGHVEGLIELGAGFHPFLSGRDNVKQRCAMLGFDKGQIEKTLNEIIDFSELEEFIDMPVQNYSSGMKARLGFASAVLVKPDVLLIDEALSVGDFEFQQKCLAKVNEIKKDAAIIFVSHSIQTMKMFCDRGIVFEKGKSIFQGDIDEASKFYLGMTEKPEKPVENEPLAFMGEFFLNKSMIENYIIKWHWPKSGHNFYKRGEKIILQVDLTFTQGAIGREFFIGIPFWNLEGVKISAINTDQQYKKYQVDKKKQSINIEINNILKPGEYLACFALVDGGEYFLRQRIPNLLVTGMDSRDYGVVDFEYNCVVK